MTCNEIRPILQIYVDNEMGAVEAHKVEDHLRECGDCEHEVVAYRRIDTLLADAVEGDATGSASLGVRVRSTVAPRGLPMWARVTAAAVALVLAPVAIWSVYRRASTLLLREAVAEHYRAESAGAGPIATGPDLSALAARFEGGRAESLNVAGLRLLGGHVCHLGDMQCAHLLYATSDGHTLSVYVYGDGGSNTGPVVETIDGSLVADIATNGVRRIVVGDTDERTEVIRALGGHE
jgi:anti-sigma factor RsiW